MTANNEQILAAALREVRDINKRRGGLYSSKVQEICRAALKSAAVKVD